VLQKPFPFSSKDEVVSVKDAGWLERVTQIFPGFDISEKEPPLNKG
jgi:hypothetical protein